MIIKCLGRLIFDKGRIDYIFAGVLIEGKAEK